MTMISLLSDNSPRRLAITLLFLGIAFCCANFLPGQETPKSSSGTSADGVNEPADARQLPPDDAAIKNPGSSDAKARYDEAVTQGREMAKACRNISLRFFDGSLAESYEWKEKWTEASKKLADHRPVFEKAAIDWFLECEKPQPPLLQIAMGASNEVYQAGNIELAFKMLEKLRLFYPEKEILLERRFALAAIKTNRFEYGLEFMTYPGFKGAIQKLEKQVDKNMFLACPLLARAWEQEAEIRKKEAEADDLPRVKLQLATGEVTFELFENEAPQTVANFISLVESGFYDDSYFHPMVKNVVVQAGLVKRGKNVRLNYTIKNESRLPESRNNFTGSLTMVGAEGSSAASVFSILLLPNPELNWDRTEEDKLSQTVFGRVVSGMEHIVAMPATIEFDEETNKEKPIKGIEPGLIEKATVSRKRDHDYKFEKIKPQKK